MNIQPPPRQVRALQQSEGAKLRKARTWKTTDNLAGRNRTGMILAYTREHLISINSIMILLPFGVATTATETVAAPLPSSGPAFKRYLPHKPPRNPFLLLCPPTTRWWCRDVAMTSIWHVLWFHLFAHAWLDGVSLLLNDPRQGRTQRINQSTWPLDHDLRPFSYLSLITQRIFHFFAAWALTLHDCYLGNLMESHVLNPLLM